MTRSARVGVDLGLTEEEKKILHDVALTAIRARVSGSSLPEPTGTTLTLTEKRGAFVSLHRKGMLRGCIGYVQPVKPLCQTIQEMALAAAFQDPRFPPLRQDELADLEIEISVLTPMRHITDISMIEVGKHGLMIVHGYSSGLLLPQVGAEYGWSREEFLAHTCIKAGLTEDAWKNKDAKIFIFSADVF